MERAEKEKEEIKMKERAKRKKNALLIKIRNKGEFKRDFKSDENWLKLKKIKWREFKREAEIDEGEEESILKALVENVKIREKRRIRSTENNTLKPKNVEISELNSPELNPQNYEILRKLTPVTS